MEEAKQSPEAVKDGEPAQAVPRRTDLRIILLRVAWLSILLGLVMQSLLALVQMAGVTEVEAFAAQLTGRISWSFIVCMGLAVGTGVSGANPPVMGLTGLFIAPIAFNISRSLQKGVSDLVGASSAAVGPDPFAIALLRGAEYLLLGLAVGWVARRVWGGAMAHIGVGLVVGLVFGSAALALNPEFTPSLAAVLTWGINEILFPVGCALVLFVSDALGKRLEQ
jgi:hypothetical protein